MNKTGNLSVKETGEAELTLSTEPTFVEVMFVDGLSDDPPASCTPTEPDRVYCSITKVGTNQWGIKILWHISKPRVIWYQATNQI